MGQVNALFPRWDLGHPSRRNEPEDKGRFHGSRPLSANTGVQGQSREQAAPGTTPWEGGQQATELGQHRGLGRAFPPRLGLFQMHLQQGRDRVQTGNAEILGKFNRL